MLFVSKVDDRKRKFDELYCKHYKLVWCICRKYIKSKEDIDDVLVAVFAKVADKVDYGNSEEQIEAFISRVTKHYALNYLKSNEKRKDDISFEDYPYEIADDTYDPLLQLQIKEAKEVVYNAIKNMSEKFSLVMSLNIQYGYTPQEIAEILEIPVKTVYGRIKRGKEQILKALREYLSVKGGVNDEK